MRGPAWRATTAVSSPEHQLFEGLLATAKFAANDTAGSISVR
jgi:hypothetical protein